MSAPGALYALLAADAGVAAVLGTRLYPTASPQGDANTATVLPYAVFSLRGREPVYAIGATAPACHESRWAVDVWSDTYGGAQAAGDAVAAALYRTSGTWDSTQVLGTRVESLTEGYDPETERYLVTVEATVAHL